MIDYHHPTCPFRQVFINFVNYLFGHIQAVLQKFGANVPSNRRKKYNSRALHRARFYARNLFRKWIVTYHKRQHVFMPAVK